MKNEQIADYFSLMSKLMDIHGDNSFKAKSYANAAFQIDRLPASFADMTIHTIAAQKGVGNSIASSIVEIIATGKWSELQAYIDKTPPGLLEMLQIKGLGAKKIHTIWQSMEITSMGELLYACNENRLLLYKGFGEKTQEQVRTAILFWMGQQGKMLFQQAEIYHNEVLVLLENIFGVSNVAATGSFRRQMEIIEQLEFVVAAPAGDISRQLSALWECTPQLKSTCLVFKPAQYVQISIFPCQPSNMGSKLFLTTGSSDFITEWQQVHGAIGNNLANENTIFETAHQIVIPPFLREKLPLPIKPASIPSIITPKDIRGIIHAHSTWSDGSNTIEEMANAAIEQGFEYLVLSDHSKSAAYAGGLPPDKVLAQHAAIDKLNLQLVPFKIYKSIESDILADGSLDYEESILRQFDLVIASIHSGLQMPLEKAIMRLLNAIENKHTRIIGHLTGRLLLSREGYPVDHAKIFDACVANGVVIEINAHPRRLDVDWRWMALAAEKGVLLSINPDAHSIEGYMDCRYGVLAAQKAGLQPSNNLSSLSAVDFEKWVQTNKRY